MTAVTSATYLSLAGRTKTGVGVGDERNNGNLRVQRNSSFPWQFQRHPCVLLQPLIIPWQPVRGVHLRWANPVIQSSSWLLAVFGGVVLVVLIAAVSDCRTAACWGVVQAIMSLICYSWAVNGLLRCTHCSCKIFWALSGLCRAAEGSMNGKLVVQQFPVLKIVWANSVPRKCPSAPFHGAAGFGRVPWKFVLWFSLAVLEVLRLRPEPRRVKMFLQVLTEHTQH